VSADACGEKRQTLSSGSPSLAADTDSVSPRLKTLRLEAHLRRLNEHERYVTVQIDMRTSDDTLSPH